MIVPMTLAHIEEVVGVHLRSFTGFFLSFLGTRFLHLYYESIVDYPGAMGYVYIKDGQLLGFVCGTVNSSRFHKYLLRTRWWRFALAALPATLRRPSIIPRLVTALSSPGQDSSREHSSTLTSVAVEPAMQGRGIGAKLVAKFLDDVRSRGISRVDLTTDRYDNDKVNTFYQQRGFHCEHTFVTPEGREMNKYVICLE